MVRLLTAFSLTLAATDLGSKPDPKLAGRISQVFIEDSVLAQGLALSPDKKELQVGSWMAKPPPIYPPEAKMTHSSGAVIMLISINKEGKVKARRRVAAPRALYSRR